VCMASARGCALFALYEQLLDSRAQAGAVLPRIPQQQLLRMSCQSASRSNKSVQASWNFGSAAIRPGLDLLRSRSPQGFLPALAHRCSPVVTTTGVEGARRDASRGSPSAQTGATAANAAVGRIAGRRALRASPGCSAVSRRTESPDDPTCIGNAA
jgi:hypothetical protein